MLKGLDAQRLKADLHVAVMLGHLILAVGYVNNGAFASTSILRVGTDDLETLGIDTSGESVPKRVLDHP
jgi:hypothetical protein